MTSEPLSLCSIVSIHTCPKNCFYTLRKHSPVTSSYAHTRFHVYLVPRLCSHCSQLRANLRDKFNSPSPRRHVLMSTASCYCCVCGHPQCRRVIVTCPCLLTIRWLTQDERKDNRGINQTEHAWFNHQLIRKCVCKFHANVWTEDE